MYSNEIENIVDPKERLQFVKEKNDEYKQESIYKKLATEMVVDEIVAPNQLREILVNRISYYGSKQILLPYRKHPVYPV